MCGNGVTGGGHFDCTMTWAMKYGFQTPAWPEGIFGKGYDIAKMR